MRLPANFALGWARVSRLAIGRVCQPCALLSTILTEQTEFIIALTSRFVLREQMPVPRLIHNWDHHRMFRLMFYSPASPRYEVTHRERQRYIPGMRLTGKSTMRC